MTVYVDEIRRWPGASYPFDGGSCHLTADTIDELHELASRIGLYRIWFQPLSVPHYDLTPRLRERALVEGAMFVPAKEQARARRRAREKRR